MQIHKFYLLLLFLSLLLPAVSMAQTPDTLYVFRFVSHMLFLWHRHPTLFMSFVLFLIRICSIFLGKGTVRNWIICYLL